MKKITRKKNEINRHLHLIAFIANYFCAQSSCFTPPIVISAYQTHHRSVTSVFAESRNEGRRKILGILLPLTVGVISQAPLLAVIANPPSPDEREKMLTEWCKGEYCTLLGGGAGYFEGASSAGDGAYDSDLKMPSLEEYEGQARLAAELASKDL